MKNDMNNKKFSISDVPAWVHYVLIGLIVVVVLFSVVKLLIWNKGTAEVQEGEEIADIEVEVLDQIFLLPDEKKAGHTFDDEETILFLGNDALTFDIGETGVTSQIASKLGATCINCGFPATTVANKNAEFSEDYPLDAFSFVNLAQSIVDGDYSRMKENAGKFEDGSYTLNTQTLEGVDFDKVDTLVIYYNAQDYLNLRIGMNPDNDSDPITYSGALNKGIKAIQEKYPYIRIVCMSFTMCYSFDSTGQLVSGDRYDFGNGKLTTYHQFMIDVSGSTGVSFIDNYYGTIHEDNSSKWMLDNIHVNADCNAFVAEHFIKKIYPNGLTKE